MDGRPHSQSDEEALNRNWRTEAVLNRNRSDRDALKRNQTNKEVLNSEKEGRELTDETSKGLNVTSFYSSMGKVNVKSTLATDRRKSREGTSRRKGSEGDRRLSEGMAVAGKTKDRRSSAEGGSKATKKNLCLKVRRLPILDQTPVPAVDKNRGHSQSVQEEDTVILRAERHITKPRTPQPISGENVKRHAPKPHPQATSETPHKKRVVTLSGGETSHSRLPSEKTSPTNLIDLSAELFGESDSSSDCVVLSSPLSSGEEEIMNISFEAALRSVEPQRAATAGGKEVKVDRRKREEMRKRKMSDYNSEKKGECGTPFIKKGRGELEGDNAMSTASMTVKKGDKGASAGEKKKTAKAGDRREKTKAATVGEKREKTSASDKRETTATDKREKTSISDKREKTAISDKRERTAISDKRDRTGISDKREKTATSDKRERTATDKRERTAILDKRDRTGISDKRDRTGIQDKRDRTGIQDKRDKAATTREKTALSDKKAMVVLTRKSEKVAMAGERRDGREVSAMVGEKRLREKERVSNSEKHLHTPTSSTTRTGKTGLSSERNQTVKDVQCRRSSKPEPDVSKPVSSPELTGLEGDFPAVNPDDPTFRPDSGSLINLSVFAKSNCNTPTATPHPPTPATTRGQRSHASATPITTTVKPRYTIFKKKAIDTLTG